MKIGDKVRFIEAMDEGDEDAIMTVIEDRDTRVLVSDDRFADWIVRPTSVYQKDELEVIREDGKTGVIDRECHCLAVGKHYESMHGTDERWDAKHYWIRKEN